MGSLIRSVLVLIQIGCILVFNTIWHENLRARWCVYMCDRRGQAHRQREEVKMLLEDIGVVIGEKYKLRDIWEDKKESKIGVEV